MERLLEDLKYGFRSFVANPTFSLIAILTLALGMGATTSMFTLVNNVLLQPLPFPDSQELVYVSTLNRKTNELNESISTRFFDQMQDEQTPFKESAYYAYDQVTMAQGDAQTPMTILKTSPNYLSMFGTQPMLGRWYDQSDISSQAVVISHSVWTSYFEGDSDILDRTISLDKLERKIIGVMPPDYSNTGFTTVDFWTPISELNRPVRVIARLQSDIDIEQAKRASGAIQRLINTENGDKENIWEIQYTSMLDRMMGETKSSLYLLLSSVLAVYLIAVLNVVNLTFAQYANRTQELAVRVSVGATRFRLLRQLFTESLLLCFVGGICGILLSAWALEGIKQFVGTQLPRVHEISLDEHTVFVAFALISLSTLATSLIPAYSIVNPAKLTDAIKQAGRKVTGDVKSERVRRLLVGSEVGVAVVLLICAGLLMRSYTQLAKQDTGFTSTNVMTGHIWLSDNFKPQPTRAGYWLRVRDALAELPNVEAVAATSTMPMGRTGIDYPVNYTFPGAPAVPRGEEPTASVRSITDGYFDLLNISILSGREFDYRDTADSPKVVVINKQLADAAWPNEDPIGNILSLPSFMGGDHTVVGVVANVKHRGLRATPNQEFFLPVTQHHYPGMTYLLKLNSSNIAGIKNDMLKTSVELESTAPMILMDSLEALTQNSILTEKLLLSVLGIFAAIALLLASIGVYGISDNMVTQRTNEIGIRMAIGARPTMIKNWIIFDTARPVLMGALIGLLLAVVTSQFMASILYGVNTVDPLTFVVVPLLLSLVGLVATWFPARRATRVHPQQALHYD